MPLRLSVLTRPPITITVDSFLALCSMDSRSPQGWGVIFRGCEIVERPANCLPGFKGCQHNTKRVGCGVPPGFLTIGLALHWLGELLHYAN